MAKKLGLFVFALLAILSYCKCSEIGQSTISIMGGNAYPVSGDWNDSSTGYDEAYYAAMSLGYKFHKNISWGMEMSYNFNHKDNETARREVKILNLTPYLKLETRKNKFIPFAVLGMGISFVNMDDDIMVPDIDDMTKRYFSVTVGGGVMYKISPKIYAGVDIRYQHISNSGLPIHNLIPTVKFSYVFGCGCK
jgi:opacity protein-like surface antigen